MDFFKQGDRVEHRNRGKGVFIEYDELDGDASIVEFDSDSDAKGQTLCVTTKLLMKIEDH